MNIDIIMKELTLEEKASLCSGLDFWHTKPVERLDIPSVMVSDGPHGLRKNVENSENPNESIKAVCFPTASALACSFDRTLLETLGKAIGEECQHERLAVALGPGCNIKRSPLCGRNFEYFSEDPYLSGQLAAAHIKGVQSRGVGTSLKHFACNNQEYRRMSVSAEVSERALREIYLAPFETAVKESRPWTVMCSYNRINGVFSSENKRLLTDILRDEWGFDGLVMSDWGAVNDRVEGIKAGLDLEMPTSYEKNDRLIVEAVKSGRLNESELDKCVRRILEMIDRYLENAEPETLWDMNRHHELARRIESECIVLLKNENEVLPLNKNKKIAFIGKFAETPRYQGGGSSHINSFKVTSALDAVSEYAEVTYAEGYDLTGNSNEILLSKAVSCAENADTAVIFAGLPDEYESEGYDRSHMSLPENQLKLIDEICRVNKNTIVVLHNGSPVEMPFAGKVKGILETYLGGQAVGGAVCDVLFGKSNPCGKLPETFPIKLSGNPSYLNFPGEGDKVQYNEGIFVGYRYYDYKNTEPLFPFGHGLSYTAFEYSDFKLSHSEINDGKLLTAEVTVRNIGSRAGKEIVQLYVSGRKSSVIRPLKELKGFEKVELKPDEAKKVMFRLDSRAFSYYCEEIGDWYAESGEYEIMVGASSADIRLKDSVYVNTGRRLPLHFTLNSTCGDIMAVPEGRRIFSELISSVNMGVDEKDTAIMGDGSAQMADSMMKDLPVRGMISFSADPDIELDRLQSLIDRLNEEVNKK
ncbi:glycoside hydrolase family 3 C-terminal domain-containing protein [Hominimerdicola sp. 21CYCFAH17_S]